MICCSSFSVPHNLTSTIFYIANRDNANIIISCWKEEMKKKRFTSIQAVFEK